MIGIGVSVVRVFQQFEGIFPVLQKIEIDVYRPFGGVVDASDVPIFPLSPCGDDIFGNFGLQHSGFVPYGRHILEKVESRLALVGLRIVANHVQIAFQNQIHGQHVASRARHQRTGIMHHIVLFGNGAESSKVVVRGAGQKSCERHHYVVIRSHQPFIVPFIDLVVQCALTGELVGISSGEP